MLGLTTTYETDFDLAAIVLTAMLLYTMFMRRSYPTKALKQYRNLLLCNLLASVADFVSAFTICNPDRFSEALNYIINIVYLFAHNMTGVFFMLYIISVIRGNLGTRVERWLWIGDIILVSFSTLSTPLTHAVIYFDEAGAYHHGPFVFILYILAVFTLAYASVLVIFHRSVMSTFQLATDCAFVVLVVCALLIQYLNPDILIENFVIAISGMMMNVAMDNPATYFYQNTSCYNQHAFNVTVEDKLKEKEEFLVIAFTFDDLSVFRKKYTDKDFDMLIFQTIRRCQSLVGSKKVFVLQDNTFALLQKKKDDAEQMISQIEQAVKTPVLLPCGEKIEVAPHFCLLQFPGEAQTANDVDLVIQDMLVRIYRKTGRHIIWDSTKLLVEQRREDAVVHALRDAIRNNGIKVLYQPIYNRRTGKFDSAEALVRLRDNPLSIYPDEFIPVAEQNGLILDLGKIVLERVCRFLQESRCDDFGIRHINVNLSMLQLVRKSAVEELVNICRTRGVSPESIVFEITETATDSGEDHNVLDNAGYLKNEGFSLSLDDYGNGYSNISNLLRFPFNQVKLDKSLLWSAAKDEASATVLENMVYLVRNIGKACVVEGVEDENMEKMCERMDVDLLQGYKYAKPISAISLMAFLKEKNTGVPAEEKISD